MKKKIIFEGSCTALITPFSGGKVDLPALSALIERQIKGGADALCIAGSTGEISALSDSEHMEVLEFASSINHGRIPMICGCGSSSTARTISMIRHASSAGYDGVLIITPYGNRPTSAGLIRHYETVADASELPVILYNVPARTGCDIPLPVYKKLSEHPNIVSVKEASGDLKKIFAVCSECGDELPLYSGSDDLSLEIYACGGIGTITVVGNILPDCMSKLYNLFKEGKTKAAASYFASVMPLINALSLETNPIPVKTALSLMGQCKDEFRLPMCEMYADTLEKLIKVLTGYGLI